MLTFFKRIRKRFLGIGATRKSVSVESTSVVPGWQHNAGRYLLYAIGEILLIMIGILLALQVNIWNENRKIRKIELELISNLREEVITNRDRMIEAISYTKRSMDGARKVVEICQGDYTEYDGSVLDSLLGQVQWAWTFDPVMGVPVSIRSSGHINTISNPDLRLFIASFEEIAKDVKEEGELLRKMIIDQFTPMIGKYVSSNNRSYYIGKDYAIVEKSVFMSDHKGLFADREVENLITYIHVWRNDQLGEESAFLKRLYEVLEIIDHELVRLK